MRRFNFAYTKMSRNFDYVIYWCYKAALWQCNDAYGDVQEQSIHQYAPFNEDYELQKPFSVGACIFSCSKRQENMALTTIQFTQEQARDIARVSPGDLRAWRKAVQYLADKPGKAARFTFADLVGLVITSELTNRFGARISDIGSSVDRLFHELAEARPAHLEGFIALVDSASARLLVTSDFTGRQIREPTLVVPCDPIVNQVSARMMPSTPAAAQSALRFPPQILKAGR